MHAFARPHLADRYTYKNPISRRCCFLVPITLHLRAMSNPVSEIRYPTYELSQQQLAQFKVSYGAMLMSGIYSFLVVAFAFAVSQLR